MPMKDSSPARRRRLEIVEPMPQATRDTLFRRFTEIAVIGIFVVLVLAALQFSRALLLPLTLAIVISMMMAPVVTGFARARISPWIGSFLCVATFIALLS